MSNLGISASKDHLYLALGSSTGDDFSVIRHDRIIVDPSSWPTVLANIQTHVESYNAQETISGVGLVFLATGRHKASAEAYKAEGLAEMECQQRGLNIARISTSRIKKSLGCENGQTWQKVAKEKFNGENSITHFTKGFCHKRCQAYSCIDIPFLACFSAVLLLATTISSL